MQTGEKPPLRPEQKSEVTRHHAQELNTIRQLLDPLKNVLKNPNATYYKRL